MRLVAVFWVSMLSWNCFSQEQPHIDKLLHQFNYKEARNEIEKIIRNDSTMHEAWLYQCITSLSARENPDSLLYYANQLTQPNVPIKYQILGHDMVVSYYNTFTWDASQCLDNIEFVENNYPKYKEEFTPSQQVYLETEIALFHFMKFNFSKASEIALTVYDKLDQMDGTYFFSRSIFNSLGLSLLSIRPDKSIECLNLAIQSTLDIKDKQPTHYRNLAVSSNNLGQAKILIGDYQGALKAQQKSWEYGQKYQPGLRHFTIEYYWHMGWIYEELGIYDKALENYSICLEELGSEEQGGLDYLVVSSFIADIYAKKKNPKALPMLNELQTKFEEIPELNELLVLILIYKADYYQANQDYQKAIETYKAALKVNEKDADYYNFLTCSAEIAESYQNLNQPDEAAIYYNSLLDDINSRDKDIQALPIVLKQQNKYANFLYEQNRWDEAIRFSEETFNPHQSNPFLDVFFENNLLRSKAYFKKYEITKQEEFLDQSIGEARLAIKKVVKRFQLLENAEDRTYYFNQLKEMVDAFKTIGLEFYKYDQRAGVAFLISIADFEKFNLIRKNLALQASVNMASNKDSLSIRFLEISQQITSYNRQLNSSLLETSIRTAIQNEKKQLSAKRDSLQQLILNQSNAKDFINFQKDISIEDLQKQCKKREATLYTGLFINDEFYSILVTPKTYHIHQAGITREQINQHNEELQQAMQENNAEAYKLHAYQLYLKLVAANNISIKKRKTLLNLPPSLNNLNFETFISDTTQNSFKTFRYLLHDYNFSQLISSQHLISSSISSKPNNRLLTIAPIFGQEVKQSYTANNEEIDSFYIALTPQNIVDHYLTEYPTIKNGKILSQLEANYTNTLEDLSNYNHILFTSHTKLEEDPLDTKLYLSYSNQDERYFLTPKDIYNSSLQADAVMLTSCSTGKAGRNTGESLFSLSHSFIFSGANNVVYSLWDIDEKTSMQLTNLFWKNVSEGKSYNEALRLAKIKHLEISRDPKLSNPYYWGGIALVGTDITPKTLSKKIWMIGLGLILLLVLIFLLKRKVS